MQSLDSNSRLRAWGPWHQAVAAYDFLRENENNEIEKLYNVVWSGGISMLHCVNELLKHFDIQKNSAYHKQVKDFFDFIKLDNERYKRFKSRRYDENKPFLAVSSEIHEKIYWNIIQNERNLIMHQFDIGLVRHSIAPVGRNQWHLSYEQLCEINGTGTTISYREGEDAVILYKYALEWWNVVLRAIEQSARENMLNPFTSSESFARHKLADKTYKYIPDELRSY